MDTGGKGRKEEHAERKEEGGRRQQEGGRNNNKNLLVLKVQPFSTLCFVLHPTTNHIGSYMYALKTCSTDTLHPAL